MLPKTNNLQLGFASIYAFRRAISKGVMQHYRIEIMQDFISKNYSCARRNIEGAFSNNKELMDAESKSSEISFVLIVDGTEFEEKVNVEFSY